MRARRRHPRVVHLPSGGFRDAGTAYNEQGEEVPRFSTRVKTVAVHSGVRDRGGSGTNREEAADG